MFPTHPAILAAVAEQRRQTMMAEAESYRLARTARDSRPKRATRPVRPLRRASHCIRHTGLARLLPARAR